MRRLPSARRSVGRPRDGTGTWNALRIQVLWLTCAAVGMGLEGAHADQVAPVPPPVAPPVAPSVPTPTTPEPTLAPTVPPTLAATPDPTLAPSSDPTPDPTRAPTLAPTAAPTPDPTLAPTLDPTLPPTLLPTLLPTPVPTLPPSVEPTLAPTTLAPTPFPSPGPTRDPTWAPTLDPTIRSSAVPSFVPSSTPTTSFPTVSPSASPTWPGTQPPSLSPAPTLFPSHSPSELPSLDPTQFPTRRPSVAPSPLPSSTPSESPTLSLQSNILEVVMFLEETEVLRGTSIIAWEAITANHIRREMLSNSDENGDDETDTVDLLDLVVGTNIIGQETQTPVVRRQRLRVLQEALTTLKITFDTALSFRSASDDLDVSRLIGSAFDTEEERVRYIELLQQSGDGAFAGISQMRVEINGILQVADPPQEDQGGVSIAIIAGAAAGGAFLVGLLGLLIYRRRQNGKSSSALMTPTTKSSSAGVVTNEIVVEQQDDISTLGDPMYAPGGMLIPGLEKDETVAQSIVSGDYDYARTYGAAGAMAPSVSSSKKSPATSHSEVDGSADMSKFGVGQDSLFSDDSSFEEQFMDAEDQFEVLAPAGKLGMVIDTPSGGVPVVHAIRDTSILADQVKVGDRLISVDDEDTTCMTAMQVSRLISVRAENPSRVLVFARTRARATSTDR